MLTYETLVTILLSGAERAGLNIQFSQEQIDPHAMVRTFTMTCFPYGITDTRIEVPYATFAFSWDAALTAISVVGTETICDLYHDPDEVCVHNDLNCAYEAILELDAAYEIPLQETARRNVTSILATATALQQVSSELTTDQEPLDIEMLVQFTGTQSSFVNRITLRQQWILDEQLHDEDLLRKTLRAVCSEFGNILNELAGFDAPTLPIDSDDEETPRIDMRTYLRPPTA